MTEKEVYEKELRKWLFGGVIQKDAEAQARSAVEEWKKENAEKLTHHLKRDGEIKFTGTENECWIKLLKSQPQSTSWAIKYEGWSIEPIETKDN